jgi:hypothetical protein
MTSSQMLGGIWPRLLYQVIAKSAACLRPHVHVAIVECVGLSCLRNGTVCFVIDLHQARLHLHWVYIVCLRRVRNLVFT